MKVLPLERMFTFCKPAYSRRRFLPKRELDATYTFSLFEYATAIPALDWDSVSGSDCNFLNREFLSVIERGSHSKLLCRYVIVYKKNVPCGILYFQVVDFQAGVFGDLFNKQVEKNSKRMSIFERYVDHNRNETLLRLVTCGNNLISGPYGFVFKNMQQDEYLPIVMELIDLIAKEDKLKAGISAVLVKDFVHPLQPAEVVKQKRFDEFSVEPNMVVTLQEGLSTLQDYLDLFSKKYRNRAKSVMKACAAVEQRYLTLQEVQQLEKEMFALYEQIFERAKFKLIKLPADYFSAVKRIFDERFIVKGYFNEGKLLAFATSFVMPDGSLEAHYIGLDYSFNNELCLYQNILLGLISEGIQRHCVRVNLGRTAAEIKTTVGAKPEDLLCYIKPQNTISRIIQKPFIAFLQPGEWTPRNPFKEEVGVEA